MTSSERNKLHRARQEEAVLAAYGKPAGQPTAAILAALARQFAQLDDPSKASEHDTVRSMAKQALRELESRYGIHLESSPDESQQIVRRRKQ